MRRQKNGVTRFDADDIAALGKKPGDELTEGQVAFLETVLRSQGVEVPER